MLCSIKCWASIWSIDLWLGNSGGGFLSSSYIFGSQCLKLWARWDGHCRWRRWNRTGPGRLRWNLVGAYSEAGRNRGILNTVKKECKRGRVHVTWQLSVPTCRHCSQHCINVNPMACKVFDGNQDYPTDRWGNTTEKPSPRVPCTWMTEMSSKAGLLSPESVLSVTVLRSLSHWYAVVKAPPQHWLRARAMPRYPNSCLSYFIPPITKLSVENIYT